ncbi:protein-disulfide reductase DsbD family protein [Psychroserpens damuponensis]|uniref:protein-disulfide reductase DsbD family protein n=1 Tax=Psychroserpens damuponensis TaxID=943936 RepID=UPI00058D5A07|nr:protein-disulfide reductase DsbD domain-containing protein [Psychroserpens damuponensis]
MKNLIIALCGLLVFSISTNAQVLEPVTWETSIEKISDTEYDLISTATIDSGWHLYSQTVPDDGPIPTTFLYKAHGDYELVGSTKEEEGHTVDDPIFQMRIKYFGDKAEFRQRIKVLNQELSIVEGEVEYMACDDEKCLPPDYVDLKFTLQPSEDSAVSFNANSNATSGILEPVKWKASVEKISDTEYVLVSTATIDEHWHLYSQTVPDGGPIPTTFDYTLDEGVELVGKTIEDKGVTVQDKVFEMEVKYFEHTAEFRQHIKLSNKDIKNIKAEVGFMACDDEKCLTPSYIDLDFDVTKSVAAKQGMQAGSTQNEGDSKSLWSIFIIAFFSGFAALLTPCVFPMIPMTVSFFTKQSKSKAAGIRNAIIYGLSIIVIYVLLGVVVSLIFGADALNALSTNVWFNLIFFALLMIFAISFLGAFEIMLPNSWANKVDSQADRGGLIGIFFMALALAIVSFSCTGPIVGTLLVEAAAGGSQVGPIVGMLGFSLAIALPFALFAAFPGWLNSLPKSGGWLNTVKVVLGFLELALAFKFLSNADLVSQWHILEREVFIGIWIAIFGALTLYLFGKIQLPHDSPLKHISVGRLLLGLLTLSFTVYMIPGLWGAPLNLISAFPPPLDYSESPYGVGNSRGGASTSLSDHGDLPDGGHLLAPHDILAFNDYDKGLAYAKTVGKPVMIDFTGWACVNCRKMEQNVWVEPKVLEKLKNDVVLISLYVDDKRKLDDDEIVDSQLKPGKKLKYIGQKWSELQTIKYKTNTQPYYVLMDHDENNLNTPVAYTPDADVYFEWLEDGIGKFE